MESDWRDWQYWLMPASDAGGRGVAVTDRCFGRERRVRRGYMCVARVFVFGSSNRQSRVAVCMACCQLGTSNQAPERFWVHSVWFIN